MALLLNALFLLALAWWLRREYQRAAPALQRWLLPALGWRLLLTAISGSHLNIDAQGMSHWSQALTARFWAQPGAALALWQGALVADGEILKKDGASNTAFFIKLLGLLNLASLEISLLNALYLSVCCFIGCWLLVRTWGRVFPATPLLAPVVALLLWPSVVWWTAGINKETVLVGSEAFVVALALRLLYAPPLLAGVGLRCWLRRGLQLLLSIFLAWVACRMRYLFALPLLGGLFALAAVRVATQRGGLKNSWTAQTLALLVLLGVGAGLGMRWITSQAGAGFYRESLYEQYTYLLAVSADRPHLEYAHLAPTLASMLRYAPLAVEQVFTRPWLGESGLPLYVGVGLENLVLLVLLGLTVVAAARGRPGRLPVALVLVLLAYCLLVTAFIGLSTPNLGTLHRYRTALLPWLLLLLLQNDYARQLLRRLDPRK